MNIFTSFQFQFLLPSYNRDSVRFLECNNEYDISLTLYINRLGNITHYVASLPTSWKASIHLFLVGT